MVVESHHQTDVLDVIYKNKTNIMIRYIKKFFALFDFNLGYNEKHRFKLLLPGVESGWNSNGSFKYKNSCEENNS